MDWIRRNWPDLLIGIALVAVIAGIIATLLTGGTFFPMGQGDATAGTLQSAPAPADLGAVGRADGDVAAPLVDDAPAAPVVEGRPAGQAQGLEQAGDAGVVALPVDPPVAEERAAGAAGPSPAADAGAAQPSLQSAAPRVDAAAIQPLDAQAAAPAAGVASTAASAPTAAASAPGAVSYRVAVGAFGGLENAERQASVFREAGFPVFVGSEGDLSIVLVGPYETQGEAEQVAARIRAGDFDVEPVIYRHQPEPGEQAAARPAAGAAASGTASPATDADQPNVAQPVVAQPGAAQPSAVVAGAARYLQVGAYATAESSLPQRERLEGLGFTVTERQEGNLIKLLVGPFEGEQLAAARSRLEEQGIENFPR